MRSKIVFGLLLSMCAAMAFLLATRPHGRPAPTVPAPVRVTRSDATSSGSSHAAAHADAGAQAANPTANQAAPDAAAHASDAAVVAHADAGVPRRMDRPMRVVALGWELIAPGVIANHGAMPGRDSAFGADGLVVHLTETETPAQIESALARGGADPHGADVAVLPLPTFVASYERLRALSPEVFLVVGWSRGREGLGAAREVSLASPPSGDVRLGGEPGDAATFLALFALDEAGVPASRLQLVPASTRPPFAALDRAHEAHDDEPPRVLFTTADATRLVPFVAVAPHGFLESHGDALIAFARVWLGGLDRLRADVPAGARQVADVNGAPDALALLQRLGMVDGTSLRDNARVAGLSGRGAVTLDALFRRAWQLWHGVGVLTTPPPETAPVSTAVITTLVRGSTPGPSPAPETGDGGTAAQPLAARAPAGATALFVRRMPAGPLTEQALADEIGFLGGVFERAPLRAAVRGDAARARAALTDARDRYDLAGARLIPGRSVPSGTPGVIEVLTAP